MKSMLLFLLGVEINYGRGDFLDQRYIIILFLLMGKYGMEMDFSGGNTILKWVFHGEFPNDRYQNIENFSGGI